jgi:hypothetical protein
MALSSLAICYTGTALAVMGVTSVVGRLDTGEQDWKHSTVALLVFNAASFAYGYLVLTIHAAQSAAQGTSFPDNHLQ